jgi:tRNA-splicing ligase RtcB
MVYSATDLIEETPYRWRMDATGGMRVPGIVYGSRALLPDGDGDKSLSQVAGVAHLPGIVDASYAMPDVHMGYGFPIGGVAATDVAAGGVVSPGGVGFDISCGVRLLLSPLHADELGPRLGTLMDALDRAIPRGIGKGAVWRLRGDQLDEILARGAAYAVEQGHGEAGDLEHCEDRGAVADADPGRIGARARERGLRQVGSLGSGNHFLEIEAVAEVFDERLAQAYGLWPGRICVMIHTGSRGLGHQICSDFVAAMERAMPGYGISVPDRQLACVPVDSAEGRAYLGAMAAAANYGRVNRQLLGQAARRAFDDATGRGDLTLLYDVSHNLAKLETHEVDGAPRHLCVHRKGATRALPPGHPELARDQAEVGQPVLVPGSMGAGSYVLAGVPGGGAFSSACHGAGRRLSRHQAVRRTKGKALRTELESAGVAVRGASMRGLAEETPEAYKDLDGVVESCDRAGLARTVAWLRPVGVVKG